MSSWLHDTLNKSRLVSNIKLSLILILTLKRVLIVSLTDYLLKPQAYVKIIFILNV